MEKTEDKIIDPSKSSAEVRTSDYFNLIFKKIALKIWNFLYNFYRTEIFRSLAILLPFLIRFIISIVYYINDSSSINLGALITYSIDVVYIILVSVIGIGFVLYQYNINKRRSLEDLIPKSFVEDPSIEKNNS